MSPEKEEIELPASPFSRLMHMPDFYICVVAVMGSAVPIDADHLKASLRTSILNHPRLSSVLVLKDKRGYKMSWKRTSVNVDNHVFAPAISPEIESGDRLVEEFILTITKTPMDVSKPLWEIYILNVKTAYSASTAILRVHHSLGDGVSLMSIILACGRKISDPESLPTLPSTTKRPVEIRGKGFPLMTIIWRMILIVYYTMMDIIDTLVFIFCDSTREHDVIMGKSGNKDDPKRYLHRIFDLEDIKLIKNSMRMTVNDVVFGIVHAALSSYVFRRYENNSVKKVKRVGLIAFNLRPSATIEDMSEVMYRGKELDLKTWGNILGFVFVPLVLRKEEEPLNYVRQAKALMDRKKLSYQSHLAHLFVKILIRLFGIQRISGILKRTFSRLTFSISNMVGPHEEISLFGYPLNYLAPTVTGFSGSIVIHIQTYANKLMISFTLDEKSFPDPEELCQDFRNSIQILKDAALKNSH